MAHVKVAPSDGGEIEITDSMIEAGIMRLREFQIGQRFEDILPAVFLAMAYRSKAIASVLQKRDIQNI